MSNFPSVKDDDVFERAIALAKKSTMTQRHGAIIIHKNQIIAEGFNHHTSYMSHKFSCHAEVAAITALRNRYTKNMLDDATMVVVRIGTDNMKWPLKYSKPCECCMKEIQKTGIRKVFYSVDVVTGLVSQPINK